MLITDSAALERFCADVAGAPYLAVDTEFMRHKNYYARLCLVQVSHGKHAAAIDTLSPDLDLDPLQALLADAGTVKVLHAASQDMEVFLQRFGILPTPVFDTQIAAQACGLGVQVGYGNLVQQMLDTTLDKAPQATNWARRPLSPRQVDYALADVTWLCQIYEDLAARVAEHDDAAQVQRAMAALVDEARYRTLPEDAWKRIRIRGPKRRDLAVLREVAAWRERAAMDRDLPRGWVLKDESLIDLARRPPRTPEELAQGRFVSPKLANGPDGRAVLACIEAALALPPEQWPTVSEHGRRRRG